MPDEPNIPKEPLAMDPELQEVLQSRPELRGKSTRAIQMQLRRERRMKLAARFVKPPKADR